MALSATRTSTAALAAERAERFAQRHPQPQPEPEPEPVLADWVFEPAPERVKATADVTGGMISRARHLLVQGDREKFRTLREVAAGAALDIQADFDECVRLRNKATSALGRATEQLNELRNALVSRAAALKRVAEVSATLQHAREQLDAPTALKLEPGELLALDVKKKHLPAEVALHQAEADRLTPEIARLATELKIDVAGLVGNMVAAACVRVGSDHADRYVKELSDQGFLKA
jgi:hypothetical protein